MSALHIQNLTVLDLMHVCVHMDLIRIMHKSYLLYYLNATFAIGIYKHAHSHACWCFELLQYALNF